MSKINMNEMTIGQNGGTTIVSRNTPASHDNQPHDGVNRTRFSEVDGSQTLTVGPDHELYQNTTPISYNAGNDPDTNPAEGFVTKHGTVQGDLTDPDNTLLRINGVEMDIPTAMRQGLVAKTNIGFMLTDKASDIMAQNAETRVENAEVDAAENTVAVNTRANSPKLMQLENAIGSPATVNLVQTSLSAASDGRGLKDYSAMETAANAAGMSEQDVTKTITTALSSSEARARRALNKAGIKADDVFDHLYTNVHPETRVSILTGLIFGDPASLNHMVHMAKTGNKR